ncbi:MAG: DUF59 domain-containing protein [Planctomycetes bacterium]|nr:DUF59 domain-containing protein [Planctomycetota bacterium]
MMNIAEIRDRIDGVLRSIRDPEIPVNIVELGLIYQLDISEGGAVAIRMTLTTPNCPVAGDLLCEVEQKVRAVEGVTEARVDLVWEPPWQKDMMSDAAKLQLDMFDGGIPSRKDKFIKLGKLR